MSYPTDSLSRWPSWPTFGPKIRVGRLAGGQVDLVTGQTVTVTTRPMIGDPKLIPSQYAALATDVRHGDHILLDDGNLELRVEQADGIDVICTVVQGGILKERKGMNLPNIPLSTPADGQGPRGRALCPGSGGRFPGAVVRAPARRRHGPAEPDRRRGTDDADRCHHREAEALDAIDEILELSDGIMVARGDLLKISEPRRPSWHRY